MDYFVDIENTPYYHWQVELLIESFKHHRLEESLVIGLTPNTGKPELFHKLFNHPRLHYHFDMGQIRGFDRMNKLYSMVELLGLNVLKQPFVAIEPDCMLYMPVDIKSLDAPHVIFQIQPFFTLEHVKEHIPNLDVYLPKDKKWLPIGSTMYFNNLPKEVFDRTVVFTEMLAYEQAKAGREIWRFTDRVGWIINLMALQDQCHLQGEYIFEMNLTDNQYEHHFISYEHPVLPYFSKKMFAYASDRQLAFGDPFVSLTELPQQIGTPASHYTAILVKKYLDSIFNKA